MTVPTAVDAEERAVAGVGNRGPVKTKALEIVLGNQIDEDASLHTDKCRAYQQLAKKLGIDLHQHKDGKSADGKRMMTSGFRLNTIFPLSLVRSDFYVQC